MILDCILGILSIVLGDSGSYLNLAFQQAVTLLVLSMQGQAYFLVCDPVTVNFQSLCNATLIFLVYLLLLELPMSLTVPLSGGSFPQARIPGAHDAEMAPESGTFVMGPSSWCPLAAQYLSASETSLRPSREVECFPWILTCQWGFLYIALTGRIRLTWLCQQDSNSIWGRNEPFWAPLCCWLGLGKTHTWVSFCWVWGHKMSGNYVSAPVLGVLSQFVFLFPPFRVLFLWPLALFYNHTYPELLYLSGRNKEKWVCPLVQTRSQNTIFLKTSICPTSPKVKNTNPILELFFKPCVSNWSKRGYSSVYGGSGNNTN